MSSFIKRGMKVLVCIPSYNEFIHSSLVKDILNFKFDYELRFKSGSLISRIRNEFLSEFVRDKSFTHLLFIDADMFDFSNTLNTMIYSGKKLIGGIYRKKMKIEEYNVNLADCIENTIRFGDIIRLKHVGGGLMLIHRDVIENMIKMFPNCRYKHSNGKIYFDLFRVGVVNERYLSEDYYFCELAGKVGYETYGVLNSEITHHGIMNYRGNFKSYINKILSNSK